MRVWSLTTHSLIFRAHNSSRYSIAALLGAIEFDTRLLELDVQAPIKVPDSLVEQALERGPTIVAHSVMSTQMNRVRREVTHLRERFGKNVILITGGPHASARPKELIELGFDYVVIGEGERTLPDMLHNWMNDIDMVAIPGVVSIDSMEYPIPRDLPRVSLDAVPPFALEMNVVGPIEVTRGCPFNCKFCATPYLTGGVVRHRSVKSVEYWLRRAVEEHGFNRTWLLSPNAFCYGGRGRKTVPEKLETLLKTVTAIDGLDEVFFGSFPSEVRPEFVTKSLLKMFRQYVANETLQIGIQSGSDRVLEVANRHHSVAEGMRAVRITLEHDFVPHVDMIFGLPSEQEEDIEASLVLCEELLSMGAKLHGHVFMPLPGSAFEDMSAGRLNDRTRSILGELSRKGFMTGSWSHQEKLAKELESGHC